MFIASEGGRTTRQLGQKGIIMICTRKDNKLKYKAAGQREEVGRKFVCLENSITRKVELRSE
jgi:hypothetical protein